MLRYKTKLLTKSLLHLNIATLLRFVGTTVNLHIIYRIPSTSVIQFCCEMTNILDDGINRDLGELLFVGDFNIHMDNTLHPDTTTFLEFMESFDLRNHTNFAAHISNHYLDLALTEHRSTIISKIDWGDLFSDHHFVDLKLAVSHPIPKLTLVKYRKLRGTDDELFSKDLAESLAEVYESADDVSSLVDGYNKSLAQVLDKHTPVKSKTVRKTHTQPWFTDSIKNEIHIRHMKEKTYLKDPTDNSYMAFYYQLRHVANVAKTAKCKYTQLCL